MLNRLGPGGPPDPGQFQGRTRVAAFPWWIHLVEVMIVVAVVIAVVVILLAVLRSPKVIGAPPRYTSPALTELDLRYARGEIDHDDYLQRRANLTGQAPAAPPSALAEPPPPEPPAAEAPKP